MKKMTKIIPILMIIVISILSLLFMDFKESSVYLKFKKFNFETIYIKYDSNSQNISENMKKIDVIARNNNVILAKNNIDDSNEKHFNVYLSLESIDDLYSLLNKNFKIKSTNNQKTNASFISTYNQNDDNQIGLIKDLFGDQFYSYYLMDQLIEKGDCLTGNYFVYYTNFQDYSNFINEVNTLLGYDAHSTSSINSIARYIFIMIICCLVFLLIFYFIFQVYTYNNNSKKIGCMRLLGFDTKTINKNMISNNITLYFITLLIIIISAIIFVKNIMIYHLLLLVIINLFIILFTYLISYLSCIIINKNYQVTNILKMENTTIQISKISYKFKIIMTVILICFSVVAVNSLDSLFIELKTYNQSKNLLDYGVLQSYVGDQAESFYYDKQHSLYLDIVNNMDTIYAQFTDYSKYTEDDWASEKKAETDGTFYNYDSVDKNYLKKEKIAIYDLNNKKVDIDSITQICYLFPKSKKGLIDSFKNFYIDVDKYYLKFNNNYIFTAYLYDDQKIDTYQINYKYIDSPILRVMDSTIKYPSFYDGLGISFFGEGLNTGLKIKLIDGSKEKTYEVLKTYIDNNGLSNLFTSSSFTTFKDYFNDEILESKLILLFISLGISITFIVYILISSELIKLYIESQKKKVSVKKLLGFENNEIFDQVFRKNLNSTLVAIVISLLVLIIMKKLSIVFLTISALMLILDYIVTLLLVKSMKLSTIYSDLKGGNYD